jgi:hypothetical protein
MQYSLAYQLGERSGGLDPDAKAYIAAVEFEDGQALESGVRKAINNFVVGCKVDGIWSAIKASCILAGARTLDGALVPLVGTAPTNNNFVSGDYNRETGLVGDGSTKYLNSNYAFSQALQNNRHTSIWASTVQVSGSGSYFGSSRSTNEAFARSQIVVTSGSESNLISRLADETSSISATSNNVSGFQGLTRSVSASYIRRAASINETITVSSLTGNDNNMFVFARNTPGNNLHTTARLSFYSIGESLDLALLDTRVSTLMTDLAAAIP